MELLRQLGIKAGLLYLTIALLSIGFAQSADHPVKGAINSKSEMVRIPGGTYEKFLVDNDQKRVVIKSFLLDTRAVTNLEFLEFVKANPKWARSKVSKLYADGGYLKHWSTDLTFPAQMRNSPVTNVSWYAANAYSRWRGKRLPTMAEWEYVGNGRVLNRKQTIDQVVQGWYSKPTPQVLPEVYSTYQNAFKVYDMHGLIWEWVCDFNSVIMEGDSRSNTAINREMFCAAGSYSATDKTNYAAFMRFAFRSSLKAKYTVSNLGFRCAADIE